MMHRLSFPCQGRKGAAAVELAFVLPFLIFAFAVVVDFSRVYTDTQALEVSTYNAALYESGFAYGTPPASPSFTWQKTKANGSATVTGDGDFELVTSVLKENRVQHLQRTLTAPLKP